MERLTEGVSFREVPTHIDGRGSVFELYDPRWAWHAEPLVFAYCFTIRPGMVKGWNLHKEHEDDRYSCSMIRALNPQHAVKCARSCPPNRIGDWLVFHAMYGMPITTSEQGMPLSSISQPAPTITLIRISTVCRSTRRSFHSNFRSEQKVGRSLTVCLESHRRHDRRLHTFHRNEFRLGRCS